MGYICYIVKKTVKIEQHARRPAQAELACLPSTPAFTCTKKIPTARKPLPPEFGADNRSCAFGGASRHACGIFRMAWSPLGRAYALAHLAAARTAGVRCAMKCLARPPCCRFPAGASARLLHEPWQGARCGGARPVTGGTRPVTGRIINCSFTLFPAHQPLKMRARQGVRGTP